MLIDKTALADLSDEALERLANDLQTEIVDRLEPRVRALAAHNRAAEKAGLQPSDSTGLFDGPLYRALDIFSVPASADDAGTVKLPDGWADELGGALATAFAAAFERLPAPVVSNIVDVPSVSVNVDGADQNVAFDRDAAGRIVGAKIKAAA